MLEMYTPQVPVMPDEPIVFSLTLSNYGAFNGSETEISYNSGLDHTTNRYGLIHRVGGDLSQSNVGLKGSSRFVQTLEVFRNPGVQGYKFPATQWNFWGDWDDFSMEKQIIDLYNFVDGDDNKWLKFEEPWYDIFAVGVRLLGFVLVED